jgi:hypothetical protein
LEVFHYGFGGFIARNSPHIVAHSGGSVGFVSYIAGNTETDDVIILLTNKMVDIELKELNERILSSLDADFGEFQ